MIGAALLFVFPAAVLVVLVGDALLALRWWRGGKAPRWFRAALTASWIIIIVWLVAVLILWLGFFFSRGDLL